MCIVRSSRYIRITFNALDPGPLTGYTPNMGDHEVPSLLDEAEKLTGRARGCDKGRLRRGIQSLRKKGDKALPEEAARLLAGIRASADERKRRRTQAIAYNYPEELPITARREEIVKTIRENQVVVLSGETGSGKTTQIPKMCLEAGRGVDGLIGCTQPRRIAALTVASRIAEELGDESLVGSKIRFHDSSRDENRIRILTDGMLLAEAQSHPSLRSYDTLIIDEAHERSLNIDVLLGMVRRLIDKRRDLKVIITSATLDTEKFSKHFGGAPIIEVSGRMYPVEIVYDEPDEVTAELSLAERCSGVIRELVSETRGGDILVFLPTEQDIRETMDLASKDYADRLNILPLFARLPASEQKKVFQTGGKRNLVAATNVAETSLTIPGIRYVVDSGLARISRYNPGTGTHGLPVDPISRASADQRAGRCGRVQDGVCIRLYSEEDYNARPRFTLPEIRRTNLAEVVLRLLDLGIRDIESFPFVDPPASAGIRDGLRTLREIGALAGISESGEDVREISALSAARSPEARNRIASSSGPVQSKRRRKTADERTLSKDGRLMARLPLDPRLAKVLIQADREGCLGDVLPIAAALSLPDPRERPPEKTGSADAAHKAFSDDCSDFIGWLNIWDGYRTYGRKGSFSSKLKKYCAENYLSFRRMKEWMDIHKQLTLVMEENGYRPHRLKREPSTDRKGNFSMRYAAIHRALLSGFLSHIARREEGGTYEATRNRQARIHPGSSLRKASPPWIMAAEMVRTTRLYARSVAAIDPLWLVDLGSDLAARNWIHPHWSRKAGAVMATEQMRLFGFLISDDAVIPYGTVKPDEAREIFIKSALVEGDIAASGGYGFLKKNAALIRNLESMQNRLRRRDLLAGEDAVSAFYSERLPRGVLDLGTLNRHLRERGEAHLILSENDLLTGVGEFSSLQDYPESAEIGGEQWKLSYIFDTDSLEDGATLKIPSGRLSELTPGKGDWLVPGMLEERIEALMRGLPKKHRRRLIPIPETAAAALEGMNHGEGDLIHALAAWLYREREIDIPPAEWDAEAVPLHLRMRYSLLDDSGREVASGRDPSDLVAAVPGVKGSEGGRTARYRKENERTGLKSWPAGGIPRIGNHRGRRPALAGAPGRR